MTFCISGIDPGSKGAVAFIWPEDGFLDVFDMPVMKTLGTSRTITEADGVVLAALIRANDPISAYLEKVHSMPTDGTVGAFTFGDNNGTIKGVLAALDVPLTRIPPDVWKKNLRVPKVKDEARNRAKELFPACAHLFTRPDKAEAAMIALYGVMHQGHVLKKKLLPRVKS
jgi:crossover junction endodeoxyribonuclease RuvC